MADPESWSEIAYIEIADDASNVYQYSTITETIDMSFGEADVEYIASIMGGRIPKKNPKNVNEVTLELYPVGVTSGTGTTGYQPNGIRAWAEGASPTATDFVNSRSSRQFRVVSLWTDAAYVPSSATPAAGEFNKASGAITGTGNSSLRYSWWGGHITDAKDSFTDGILKTTVTFKFPPFNRLARGMFKAEEKISASITELPAYTAGLTPTV